MINKTIEICLKNRFLVIAAFALIIIWGFSAMNNTPIDAIPDIGENFGGRDHSTVIHAYDKIQKDLKRNQNVKNLINRLMLEINC